MSNTEKSPYLNSSGPSQLTPALPKAKLNDFSHREDLLPEVQDPGNVISDPTPAQKERIVYLVDDALDTLETLLQGGKEETRLKAAENVLDRAGLGRNIKQTNIGSNTDIPAGALVEVIQGLAKVFGVQPARSASHSLKNALTAPQQQTEKPALKSANPVLTEPSAEKPSPSSKLPSSYLSKHGG